MRSVTTHNSGDATVKFGAFWSKYYSGGSDTATLTQSADACLQIAHVCREHADGIRRARKEVIALAVAAAATVAVGLVLTFVSFGASDVAAEGAAAAITAEALALEETFSTLLMGVIRTALMGALKGAAFSMAYDAIIVQPIEMHFEPGRHFSIDEVGEWGLQGAAFGGAFEGAAASVRALRMAKMLEVQPESAELFSRAGSRTNLDVLRDGGGLPRDSQTVESYAARAGIDLKGVRIHLVSDEEEARYLDYWTAVAYTPQDMGGMEIRLGPASFTDEETLVKTIQHEMTHVEQLQGGQTVGTGPALAEAEDQAYASEAAAWQRFEEYMHSHQLGP